ncbi:hypothetical protein [Pseudoalteromonas holothuriae]|nr:hypothetical protein [Pseudoalteromonas sp. CIP111951]
MMASYAQAFKTVMTLSGQKEDAFCVALDQLSCWQTMKAAGFSQPELYTLFKQQYCEEIWQQLRGNELIRQDIANLLFKASVNGYVDILLSQLQQHFELPISGQMCDQTLLYINQLEHISLTQWLRLSTVYFDQLTPKKIMYLDSKSVAHNTNFWLH